MPIRLRQKDRKRITKAKDIYELMQAVFLRASKHDRNKEHFWVLGLKTDGVVSYIELVALGSVNKTFVNPMEVFSLALQKKCSRIILVHNHPSGNLIPSEEDLSITRWLFKAGLLLQVQVVDHLIITEESYTSLFDAGFIQGDKLEAEADPQREASELRVAYSREEAKPCRMVRLSAKAEPERQIFIGQRGSA